MPGCNGSEVRTAIRKIETEFGTETAESAKIIFVSSDDDTKALSKTLDQTRELFLIKPVVRSGISKAMAQLQVA
jgi:PleD family two-component response regulator